MIIELKRYKESKNGKSTLGKVFIDGNFECYSLELLWKNNQANESRIIAGEYIIDLANWGDMNARYAKRFGDLHKGLLMLMNVPGRTGILIHMGINFMHSKGCIIAGSKIDEKKGVLLETEDGYRNLYSKIIQEIKNKPIIKVVDI